MKIRFALVSVVLAPAAVLGLGAAGSPAATSACPTSNPPNELALAGGSGQTAQLGKAFSAPFQVKLANTNGCPVTGNLAGYDVTFDAPGSGPGGVFAGTGTREATVGTDGQGVATAPSFTANFTAGSYTVDVHSDFGTVELFLSNTAAGLAASIAPAGGTPQEAPVDSRYPQPLQARVTDAAGNPVQGAAVSFSIVPGPTGAGGAFLGGGQAPAATDSNGIATSPPLQANGSPGRFTAVASVDGVTTVATFALDNHAASAALGPAGPAGESATIGGRYPRPLSARVVGADGQPVEGALVTFTLGSAGGGGGSGGGGASPGATFAGGAAQAAVLTGTDGEATTPPIVANGTAGSFTATATTPASATTLVYTLHNRPPLLAALGGLRRATVGRRYGVLRVRARSAGGTPAAGVVVTFSIGKAASGATAAFADGTSVATAVTNGAGVATSPALTASGVAGTFRATAAVSGGRQAAFRLRNRAGEPAAVAAGAADGTSATTGSRLPVRLAVTVTDANGNPVAGALVRFAAPANGPGGRFTLRSRRTRVVRVRANGRGIAIAPPFTANGTPGGYTVDVRAGSCRAAFALVNTTP